MSSLHLKGTLLIALAFSMSLLSRSTAATNVNVCWWSVGLLVIP
jgi:hypothetical protein